MDAIVKKLYENKDSSFIIRVAIKHVNVLDKYGKNAKIFNTAAFPSRQEYQKFAIAKFFLDTLGSLEMQKDLSLTGFRKPVDDKTPPLEAFHLTSQQKKARKRQFCKKIDKGDVLHLKVIEESETEYKLLVLNKYGESERLVDYSIFAYLIKTYHLERFWRPLKVSDFLRATVLGKLKLEENVFTKLLVSVNAKVVNAKYEGIELGLISKDDISFYPEDISKYKNMFDYLKNKPFENCKVVQSRMASLSVDVYKVYSFHKSINGIKYDLKDIDSWTKKLQMIRRSIELLNYVQSAYKMNDFKSALSLLDRAIKDCPMDDLAFSLKGRIFKDIWVMENKPNYLRTAIEYFKKALQLNPYNQCAKNDLHGIYIISVKKMSRKGDDSPEFEQVIMQIAKDNEHYLKWKHSSGLLEENMSPEKLLESLNLNEKDLSVKSKKQKEKRITVEDRERKKKT